MKNLKEMLIDNMWVYEFDGGDKGLVLAANLAEAQKKLSEHYPTITEMVKNEEAFIYSASNIEISGDIFVIVPW